MICDLIAGRDMVEDAKADRRIRRRWPIMPRSQTEGAIELGEGALAAIRANMDGTGRINSPDADRF